MKDEPVFVYGKKKMKDESDFERTFGLAPTMKFRYRCNDCGKEFTVEDIDPIICPRCDNSKVYFVEEVE